MKDTSKRCAICPFPARHSPKRANDTDPDYEPIDPECKLLFLSLHTGLVRSSGGLEFRWTLDKDIGSHRL